MQIRYLETITLKKAEKVKQENGVSISQYVDLKDYKIQVQDIFDETSISVYGSTINKMYRISSPKGTLEKYLKPKIINKADNISLYYIVYNSALFAIKAVKNNWVDIEFKEPL